LSEDAILIVGGGLGGLAAALALARKGRRSIVLEQAQQFGEIGAGIQLAPMHSIPSTHWESASAPGAAPSSLTSLY
jgi:salicylate hydroxylase